MAVYGVTGLPPRLPTADTRRPTLPGWPLFVLVCLYPFWWVLGFSALIWDIIALPMLAFLLVRRDLVVPRGFGAWCLFLLWVVASGFQLAGQSPTDAIVFAYRLSVYLAATVFLLYVLNLPVTQLPSRVIALLLGSFFMMLVAWGYAGLVLSHVTFRSATEALVPRSLARLEYVQLLVHPRFAEVQDFLGYSFARPSAPFPFTNWWGGNVAALMPFAIASVAVARSRVVKGLYIAALALALVPAVLSVNRGMWMSATLGLAYAGLRRGLRGNFALARALSIAFAVLLIGVWLTPARQLVIDRLDTPGSESGRSSVVQATIAGVSKSPLIGYAVPGERRKSAANLAVGGTSGIVWMALYTSGWPGLVFFLGWVGTALVASCRPRSLVQFWAHVSMVIIAIQMFFYEMLPVELTIFMIATAVAFRPWTLGDGAAD